MYLGRGPGNFSDLRNFQIYRQYSIFALVLSFRYKLNSYIVNEEIRSTHPEKLKNFRLLDVYFAVNNDC